MLTLHAILWTGESPNIKSETFYDMRDADQMIRRFYDAAAPWFRRNDATMITSHEDSYHLMDSFEMRNAAGAYAVANITGSEEPEPDDISYEEWEEENYPS